MLSLEALHIEASSRPAGSKQPKDLKALHVKRRVEDLDIRLRRVEMYRRVVLCLI